MNIAIEEESVTQPVNIPPDGGGTRSDPVTSENKASQDLSDKKSVDSDNDLVKKKPSSDSLEKLKESQPQNPVHEADDSGKPTPNR